MRSANLVIQQGGVPDAPPFREPVFLFLGLALMLAAIAAVLLWQRGRPSLLHAFTWGAAAWAIASVLKLAWQIPVSPLIQRTLSAPLFYLYAGLATGAFECGVPLLVALKTRLKRSDWNEAVAFAIGFGAIETFLAGAATFLVMAAVMRFREHISADSMAAIANAFGSRILGVPLAITEQLAGVAVDVFAGVFILYGVRMRQWRWFWMALAYKAGIGAFEAGGGVSTAESIAKLALAAVGLAGVALLRRRFKALPV